MVLPRHRYALACPWTEAILREHEATVTVPTAFFDDLLAALDAPAKVNKNLANAFQRSRELVTRQ